VENVAHVDARLNSRPIKILWLDQDQINKIQIKKKATERAAALKARDIMAELGKKMIRRARWRRIRLVDTVLTTLGRVLLRELYATTNNATSHTISTRGYLTTAIRLNTHE
jgi:hypothetical protein